MPYPGGEPDIAASPGDLFDRAKAMVQFTPQAQAIGIELTSIADGKVIGRAPYRAELVGDPRTGVIAGGVITTLLDQISGVAAVTAMTSPSLVATIDLRIDYMRAAEPGRDVIAQAQCIRLTRSVAFIQAVAFEDSPDNPIAHAAAAFMITAPRKAPA